MNPLPAPKVPGNTEAERFDNAVRKMFSVSKKALLAEEFKQKHERTRTANGRSPKTGPPSNRPVTPIPSLSAYKCFVK